MRILLFIFLIIRTQQDVFDQFIQNETYRAAENQLQQTEKSSLISNKVLLVIIVCLSIIVIATYVEFRLIR
jgi:Ca2+/H+ antiporter